MAGPSRVSAAAPYVLAPLWWFLCMRCDNPFYTNSFRGCCDVCQDAAAQFWPGVLELPREMGGE